MTKDKPTILCAVAHAQQVPWIDIWMDGQVQTWQKYPDNNRFEIINIFGQKPAKFTLLFDAIHEKVRWTNRYVAKVLAIFDAVILFPFTFFTPSFKVKKKLTTMHTGYEVKFPDTYVTFRWKMLSLIKYFLQETNRDFLIVTSTSSYLRPKIILQEIESMGTHGVYLGPLPYEGARFVSGSFRLMSRDVAEMIWNNRGKFKSWIIEDHAMGLLLAKLGVSPMFFPLANVTNVDQASKTNSETCANKFHFRLKSFSAGERNDVEIMGVLHANFQNELI